MNIVFADDDLKKVCEDERRMTRTLGREGAKKLKARLADLEAAQVVTDVKRGNPHPLKGDRKGHFSLRLHGGYRLILECADQPPPQFPDGATDWSKVRGVRLLNIEDYHD